MGGQLMGAKTPLGPLELEILEWVQDHAPATVRMAVEQFNQERELARTTILTVMERLRKKGYLERRMVDGLYEYSPSAPMSEVQSTLVGDFIRTMLGDSLTPFVAYLSRRAHVSEAELAELKRLVQELDERREGEPKP
jgi:predicted transcriptional regulator